MSLSPGRLVLRRKWIEVKFMLNKLSLQDLPLKGKKVLMRVDFNVPLDKTGKIEDDSRIKASLISLDYVIKQEGILILMSHLGRPKGKKDPAFSLAPCAKRLSELLKRPVKMASDCIGCAVEKQVTSLEEGDILVLENLRFYPAEEHPEKDPHFARSLAKLGNIYVNDAFASSHRKHTSITEVPKLFPQHALAGFLMDKELAFLTTLVQKPKRPFYAILGGSKVSSKVGVIINLIEKIDGLFIGGAMAYTFLKAQGIQVGKSLLEADQVETAKDIMKRCQEKAVKFWLPEDIVTTEQIRENSTIKIQSSKENLKENYQGVDIGPKTIASWKEALQNASMIFWNGPVGVFEIEAFSRGTKELATILASLAATKIVGGGDSVAAIQKWHMADQFTHLSTGGGASLEFIETGSLPGIDCLTNR